MPNPVYKYMLYSHDTTIRIHIHAESKSTIMTNEHTSLEKYTSHTLFSKGLCVRGELETEQTATYWLQVPLSLAAFLSHTAELLNQRSWGPKPSAVSWFSQSWTPTCFPWASQSHWIQPVHGQGYIMISSTGYTCFLIDGWVEG